MTVTFSYLIALLTMAFSAAGFATTAPPATYPT